MSLVVPSLIFVLDSVVILFMDGCCWMIVDDLVGGVGEVVASSLDYGGSFPLDDGWGKEE